jgi:ADP-ribose pyrophosphatase
MTSPKGVTQTDPFAIVATHTAYENPWISIEHQDVLRPDGQPGVYGIVRFANRAVAILPVATNGDVWLVGQFRRPHNRWSWELPEGGVPFDEDMEAGARRELEEEVGLIAHDLIKLLDFDPSNCVSDEVGACYLATGLTRGTLAPDPTEVLSIRRLHFTDLLAEIDKGLIRDAPTLVTVLRAHQLALTGKLPHALANAMLVRSKEPTS